MSTSTLIHQGVPPLDTMFLNRFHIIKQILVSGTGNDNSFFTAECRSKNEGFLGASLTDIQNMVNLVGKIPGLVVANGAIYKVAANVCGKSIDGSSMFFTNMTNKSDFLDYLKIPVNSQPDNCGLIYYSGHGTNDGYLAVSNGNYITAEDIAKISNDINLPFLIVLDMCHAGKFGEDYFKYSKVPGSLLLCSCHSKETSLELPLYKISLMREKYSIVFPGMISENAGYGQGLFTAAFTATCNNFSCNLENISFEDFVLNLNKIMIDIYNTCDISDKAKFPLHTAQYFSNIAT